MIPNYIYAKVQAMVAINDITYKNLARILNSAIGEQEYFNGAIEFDAHEYHSRLILTLMIYREPLLDPSDKTHSAMRITKHCACLVGVPNSQRERGSMERF